MIMSVQRKYPVSNKKTGPVSGGQVSRYFEFYNGLRPHSSLGRMTPDQSYFNLLPAPVAA